MQLSPCTLLVIAFLVAVVILSNRTEGIAPWKTKKSKKSKPGQWYNILTSFYGKTKANDNGVGAGGVDLFKFPYTRRINNTYGTRTIYPVAVPTRDVQAYQYAILEIRNGNKRIFAQVVDECADGDCGDNIRKAKNKGRKLIDIHATAFDAIGENDGLKNMKARVISPGNTHKRDNHMRSVLTPEGRKGWVKSNWA